MRYVVNGIDAGGKHKRAVVEAADEGAARTMVQGVGLTVTGVEHAGAAHVDHPTNHFDSTPHASGKPVHVPDYPGLHIGAWVVRLFGLGAVALGVLSLYPVVSQLSVARRAPEGITRADLFAIEPVALVSFTLFGACAILFVLAAIAIAVRDIARNSFRK